MKSNDIIKTVDKALLVQFGSTGESQNLSALRIDGGLTFSRSGLNIFAKYHNVSGDAFLIESFSSESLASTAYQNLLVAVRRYAAYRRAAKLFKNIVKWIIAPTVLVMIALALNVAATRPGTSNSEVATGTTPPMAPLPSQLLSGDMPIVPVGTPAGRANVMPASELAKAMSDGAKSGKYTVQLSKGKKGTLYVFSDPSCPHCQDLEPELDKLAKDYTIYVFPVTVIGGEASSHRAAKLLCAKADARASGWRKIVAGDDLEGSECSEGALAVQANDKFFRVMKFIGTPTIINANGQQTPDAIPNTAEAIDSWMMSSAIDQK